MNKRYLRNVLKLKNGFTVLEVIIAMAITLLVLTALLSLEVRSTILATKVIHSFQSLPYAIERIEDVSEQDFAGNSQEKKGKYEIRTSSREILTGDIFSALPITRINVEVWSDGEFLSSLSLIKIKFKL